MSSAAADAPQQAEMPFAIVQGSAVTELPKDLYIPPDALEVILEAFEGPLDLLLYLIRRQNLDILDIPIAEITRQYVEYVELMRDLRLELAAEYLVMAAMLAEIKARMLMPRPQAAEEEGEDPRAELVRRLQEYERYKTTAEELDQLPRIGRDNFVVEVSSPDIEPVRIHPTVSLADLLHALKDVMVRAERFSHHSVQMEPLSVRERMSRILEMTSSGEFMDFHTLFSPEEGRRGAVVSFLALLELVRGHLLELHQLQPFAPIRVRGIAS